MVFHDYYGLKEFTKNVTNNIDNRCSYCYTTRLSETAKYAYENNYDAFCTTLLISPYQNHEKIIEIGNKLAEKYGIKFYYYDFRPYFREGQAKARELGFYMQKYCGCIYSEEERYQNKIEKDKKIFSTI